VFETRVHRAKHEACQVMRRAGRVDANQQLIVNALRRVGCSVAVTSNLGGGFPDLVVGRAGHNYLMEVKDGDKPPSRQRLTEDEMRWHEAWRGQVYIVYGIDDALAAVGVNQRRLKP